MINPWRSSPREVDLLSWFTGPLVPIVFGGIATTFGVAVILAGARDTESFLLAYSAVIVMVLAFWVVAFFASPQRLNRGWMITVIPITMGAIAHGLAVTSEWGSSEPFELRWSSIVLALLIASLAPYLSAVRIIAIGAFATALTMALAGFSMTADTHPTQWPTFAQPVIASSLVMIAVASSAVFSYQVVARTQRWATSVTGDELSSGVLGEAARRKFLIQELASVSDRVLPLLERVVAAGVVTVADRREASDLSESLRAELVERSNRSWLDSYAGRMNFTVIDHDRLAGRMSSEQRSALLGLLTAAVEEKVVAAQIVIELRAEADGSTALAISADQTLPEGHRLTMLAPHYVSLVAAADDVEWDTSQSLSMRFRVPPRDTDK
ncbi:MAG: hypothetical protein ABIT21_03950 [Terrimesophilobacter sp.]